MSKKILKIGDKAPKFKLKNHEDAWVQLGDFKGKTVVLYFYPKDNTSGCTREACDFRDAKALWKKKKISIFGVSKDSVESHRKFRDKQELNFDLLSDPEGQVCNQYGVWQEKKNYGKSYMGIVRSTFVIDGNGTLRQAHYGVRVNQHVAEVLEGI